MSDLRTVTAEIFGGVAIAAVIAVATFTYTVNSNVQELQTQQVENQRVHAIVHTMKDEVVRSSTILGIIVKNQEVIMDDLKENREVYLNRNPHDHKSN